MTDYPNITTSLVRALYPALGTQAVNTKVYRWRRRGYPLGVQMILKLASQISAITGENIENIIKAHTR